MHRIVNCTEDLAFTGGMRDGRKFKGEARDCKKSAGVKNLVSFKLDVGIIEFLVQKIGCETVLKTQIQIHVELKSQDQKLYFST